MWWFLLNIINILRIYQIIISSYPKIIITESEAQIAIPNIPPIGNYWGVFAKKYGGDFYKSSQKVYKYDT